MNKNKLKLIFGLLAVIIAVSGFFVVKWVKESNENETNIGEITDEYIPEAEISDEQARQTIVSLYFPNKQTKELTPEARLVDIKEVMNVPYEKLMNLLIEGPKNDKLENIIPENTKVLKTFLDGECLVIDLTKDFLNYDMEQENTKENLINSIVNTMTQLTEVNEVKFLIEGKENELLNDTYKKDID